MSAAPAFALVEPLFIDIETVPLASALAMPYPAEERTPPANYKNEDAIARWRESDQKRWAEERTKACSLNPRLGRVVCIGLGGSTTGAILAREENEEAAVLDFFWGAVRENESGLIVTWNGTFDLRFLVIRSLAHGIAPSVSTDIVRSWFARYRTYPHFDCKAVLTNWETRIEGEGLSEWSMFLGGDGKTQGMSGADVYPLYQLGHFDDIAAYCAQDVQATRDIYHRIAGMFR